MDCRCLNSNGKNAKSTAGETDRWAGRTVRQGDADRPPETRGLSAQSTELHPILLRITDRPPVVRGQSARKRIFTKTFTKNDRYYINVKLADRPP
jgi:hypothetical protein